MLNWRYRSIKIIALLGAACFIMATVPAAGSGSRRPPLDTVFQAGPVNLQTGVNVVFLVDQSASMGGRAFGSTDHPKANDELGLRFTAPRDAVAWLGESYLAFGTPGDPQKGSHAAVVYFGDSAEVALDWQTIAPTSREVWDEQYANIETRLSPQTFGSRNLGNTDFLAAFTQAEKLFQQLPSDLPGERKRIIILITDGLPYIAPGRSVSSYMQELGSYIERYLPDPQYAIHVLYIPAAEDYWNTMEPYWRRIVGDTVVFVPSADTLGLYLYETLRRETEHLPSTSIASNLAYSGSFEILPYVDSMVITCFADVPDACKTLLIYDPLGHVTEPSTTFGEQIVKFRYQHPMPGIWRVVKQKGRPEIELMTLASKIEAIFEPSNDVQPFTALSIRAQFLDSTGVPVPPYSDSPYQLTVSARITASDGKSTWNLPMKLIDDRTYGGSFIPVTTGTHTVKITAITRDLQDNLQTIAESDINTFSVTGLPIAVELLGKEMTSRTFTRFVEAEWRLRLPNDVTEDNLHVTISTRDKILAPDRIQRLSDNTLFIRWTPTYTGSHTLAISQNAVSVPWTADFHVQDLKITRYVLPGDDTLTQYSPSIIKYDLTDSRANPVTLAPGYRLDFNCRMYTDGHNDPVTVGSFFEIEYGAQFTPTLALPYALLSQVWVVDPNDRKYQLLDDTTELAVLPASLIHADLQIAQNTGPRLVLAPFKSLFSPRVILRFTDAAGQPPDLETIYGAVDRIIAGVKLDDSNGRSFGSRVRWLPLSTPGMFVAQIPDLPMLSRYDLEVKLTTPPPGYALDVPSLNATLSLISIQNCATLVLFCALLIMIIIVVAFFKRMHNQSTHTRSIMQKTTDRKASRELRMALGVMGALVVIGVGISLALQPELLRPSGKSGVGWRNVVFIAAAVAVGVTAVVQGVVALAEWFGKQRARPGAQPETTEGSEPKGAGQQEGHGSQLSVASALEAVAQRSEPGKEGIVSKDLESLRRQLVEMEDSLRLIEERKAEYVLGVDVPLTLVKEERRLRERIEEIKRKIRRLEGGEPADIGAPSGGKPTAPTGGSSTAATGAPATTTNVIGDGSAGGYHSCFISYSSRDEGFAEKLHGDLVSKGVECWFAPEDMRIGDKIRQRIDDEIRQHAKLLLILSANSVMSDWVESEVEAAFEKERSTKTTVLFPIRLDDAVMSTQAAWAADIRRTRHIGDFRGWKEHDAYRAGFERLVRDLKAEVETQS